MVEGPKNICNLFFAKFVCFVNLLNLAEQFISQVLLCTVDSEKWIPVLKTKSFKEESQEHLLLKQHLFSYCWVLSD